MTSKKASGIFRGRFGIFYFQLEFSAGVEAFWDVILRPPAENSHFRFHGTVACADSCRGNARAHSICIMSCEKKCIVEG